MRSWHDLFIGLDDSTTVHDHKASTREGDGRVERKRWLGRFKESLSRSRKAMAAQFTAGVFDPSSSATWERIEEGLIGADVGVSSTVAIVQRLEAEAVSIPTSADLAPALRRVAGELMVTQKSARIDLTPKPMVLMMVGVNGTGKTTTIGKLASRLRLHGHDVVIAAGDTFRAAAAEQLEVWAERSGATFVRTREGGDPAAVAFDAIAKAKEIGAHVVLLDTAGRLHTKTNLMAELEKVRKILDRELPGAPHETLLSIDATTGQNGMRQAKEFAAAVDVSGVVLTKLDGTAKGGIAVAIASELGIPIKLVGIGEGIDDLQPFDSEDFLTALFPDDVLASD